jgi:hypothetical protein
MAAPTSAPFVSLSSVLRVEAPNTEEEAGEHRAPDDGQQQHRERFLDRERSQDAHTPRVALSIGLNDRIPLDFGPLHMREFGGARLGSGFGSVPRLEFVWVRLHPVPSVALLLPISASLTHLVGREGQSTTIALGGPGLAALHGKRVFEIASLLAK